MFPNINTKHTRTTKYKKIKCDTYPRTLATSPVPIRMHPNMPKTFTSSPTTRTVQLTCFHSMFFFFLFLYLEMKSRSQKMLISTIVEFGEKHNCRCASACVVVYFHGRAICVCRSCRVVNKLGLKATTTRDRQIFMLRMRAI